VGARVVEGGRGRETVNRKRKLSAVFYNRYKIVVYTGLRSDSIIYIILYHCFPTPPQKNKSYKKTKTIGKQ
jgi:hypothetical protein